MIFEKKLRTELIRSKLEKLADALEFIEKTLPSDFSAFKSSKITRNAVYKEVEFAIELVLDLCAILHSDLRLGIPETEDSIFDHLGEKVFDKKIIILIQDMKKFRNLLVHRYGTIDDARAFENILEGLKDFEKIIMTIEEVLKKYS